MYSVDQIKNMVFIDIETVSWQEQIDELLSERPALAEFWQERVERLKKDGTNGVTHEMSDQEIWEKTAALFPEWGKVICISIGQIKFDDLDEPIDFVANSFYGEEHEVLSKFMKLAENAMFKNPSLKWVGHNIKSFDLTYLIKRAIINGIKVPKKLHLHDIKPWELPVIDTWQMWQFGGFNNSVRLAHLTELLNVPTPKDDLHGSKVNAAYWNGELERIKDYCEKDVLATANIILRISDMSLVA